MREIVFDTETTGLDPAEGHRIIEIGCLELINHIPTGQRFHQYTNPERDVPAEAQAVHGLTTEFLAGHPVFSAVAENFLKFIGDSPLVAHNAEFDMKFINAELVSAGLAVLSMDRVSDTLMMARKKFPGSPASLDALCRRFEIDNSGRELHGALLDAQLLAEVYLELMGGRQHGLGLKDSRALENIADMAQERLKHSRPARVHAPTQEELAAHAAMLAEIKDALWGDTAEG